MNWIHKQPLGKIAQYINFRQKFYMLEVKRECDINYSHLVRLFQQLEKVGMLESEKKGRKRWYWKTKKGNQYFHNLFIAQILEKD